MKTVLLFGHGGYYNRGCEAIVRSTAKMLRDGFGAVRLILVSYDVKGDEDRSLHLVDEIIPHLPPRWSPAWAMARLGDKFRSGGGADYWAAPIKRVLPEVDLMLSIGGDNYCYSEPNHYFHIDNLVRAAGIPTVLWGASVHVNGASTAKLDDLKAFSLITARESVTVNNLSTVGIHSNVLSVADPAFTMESEPIDAATFWPQGTGTLGFNISPLLGRYRSEGSASTLVESSVVAIRHAVDSHGLGVLLIPQVTQPMPLKDGWNDDAVLLRRILQATARPGSVSIMPSTFTAPQTKHVISQCRMFIGARTHATIAALSTCVPTISIGYSVKAEGINLDIFGNTDHVCNVGALSGELLTSALDKLERDESTIRSHLAAVMPQVKARAYGGLDRLASLMRA